MKIDLITRPQLEVLNKKGLKYPLAEAETDYFLAVILKIIYGSDLSEILVFKGGTAIHHCYLDQLRFSKDLDFTSLRSISLSGLENVFREHDFIGIKNFNEKKYSVDFYLQYQGILQQPSSINVNINTNQKVLLNTKKCMFQNNYGVEVEVNLMNIKEIAAEKIRTLNERVRARDLYDLYLVIKNFDLDLKEIINILSKKELF
ncbi:MAG: nucleotidyl transferase AbiEii/AbiGii toxin family protein, partial [Candidatus Aminicenantes bacterium]|nr:nucleotidyl transferase AbiEii/AbiGii toxin family protein [Candidatus Aminicenantes bacterium]